MCLITRFPRIKTKKDIEVYKVLRHDLTSPYQDYQYSLTSLAVSNLKALPVENYYIADEYAKDILPSEVVKSMIEPAITAFGCKVICVPNINLHLQTIEDGLHSYRNIPVTASSILDDVGCIICKAIIPAGSYIYINYNEIVSDKLIVKEQIYP